MDNTTALTAAAAELKTTADTFIAALGTASAQPAIDAATAQITAVTAELKAATPVPAA